jgi:hypothetical protein
MNHSHRVFTVTIASGTTTSTEADIERNYDHVYLLIPATSVGNTRIFMSKESGGTYYPAATAAGANVDIASSISGKYVQLADHGRFNKVIASTAPADGASYTCVCFS